ncbi:opioid-binding protein/cell adhesion molecule homolog isoform X2 [Aplysia californica]|uniref:Opioid-binding protein/cell adhesion molecule homolog isoform X2 n=1 Tax=Aplysia californica TaxID=6500 RepID=A0ABM0ZXY1_APLCA|nr:opioid-binding protein/cell adhesion molecule homolog isoform X2 [Aplysia californica]
MDFDMKLVCVEISVLVFLCLLDISQLMTLEPSFDSPMANVTVKEMATAILPCSVKFLGRHEVVWTDQWSTLLTYEDRRIIDDERLSVERPFTKDWNLHIRNVKYKDQGLYNCQINTNPVKIKTVNLKVQVPAKILNNQSNEILVAREGDTITLMCNVSGIPMPTVTWFRLTTNEKGEEKKKVGISGEVLIIHNISRHCGDTYECNAFNGVPPPVNKLMKVSVEFPPEIELPNKRMGQDIGKETILECIITANPQAIGIWRKDGTEMKTLSGKFRVELYREEEYSVTLSLRIMYIEQEDYGHYTCEASNKLGMDSGSMELYDYSDYRRPRTTTPPPTRAPLPRTTPYPPRHNPYQQPHNTYVFTPRPNLEKGDRVRFEHNRPKYRPNHRPAAIDQQPEDGRSVSSNTESGASALDPAQWLRVLLLATVPVVLSRNVFIPGYCHILHCNDL